MKKTLGGDRLGAGHKMEVDLHNYGKSTHNLSRAWRSSMTVGTLVPFLIEPTLNGDSFEIDLTTLIRTLPTSGPIFGSFKLQLDVFSCPMRLYIAALHNNKLGIGMKMKEVYMPQMSLRSAPLDDTTTGINRQQINPSSLLAYLGQRGLGKPINNTGSGTNNIQKNALGVLMYADIYKNYYANKQEEIGFVLDPTGVGGLEQYPERTTARRIDGQINNDGTLTVNPSSSYQNLTPYYVQPNPGSGLVNTVKIYAGQAIEINGKYFNNLDKFYLQIIGDGAGTVIQVDILSSTDWVIERNYNVIYAIPKPTSYTPKDSDQWIIKLASNEAHAAFEFTAKTVIGKTSGAVAFQLSNIDDMREQLLQAPTNAPVDITELTAGQAQPYIANYGDDPKSLSGIDPMRAQKPQAGLLLKTYLSDRFNNWLSTEWIDGPDGITAITSIDTSEGSFSMDTLNLAQKIYNLLNRVAVSGGSYEDWQEAVYGQEALRRAESPIYCGGMSAEIAFDEVVSTADATAEGNEQPLGSLGGRGFETKKRGGKIHIETKEPSFIMGIVSITPRVDYSQGNKWWTRLKTMDDWHKPELDGIGFQELITDELAAFDTEYDGNTGEPTYKSAGKQPAWIEYMTSQNEVYGNFADPDKEMFMTLVRRYEKTQEGNIADLTTYIDPTKYNYAFAFSEIDQQNFWVQIGIGIKARRKMSAKIMPNL